MTTIRGDVVARGARRVTVSPASDRSASVPQGGMKRGDYRPRPAWTMAYSDL
ncbi:MAG: hypothetical protein M3354_03700 [Chloroflexota bacterium]|nr:hypothetical protein [Chloroflexota bacterium]